MVFCENLLTKCVVLLYSMDSEKEKTANGGILMNFETMDKIKITERVKAIKERLIDSRPQIESDRARLITESYKMTENLPVVKRRSAAFRQG